MNVKIPKNGEIRVLDEGKVEVFQRDHWQETDMSVSDGEIDTGMNLYDLNKQIISQLPNLTEEQLKEKISVIKDYDEKNRATYYMMLCNDLRYYTVFDVFDDGSEDAFGDTVIDCLTNFVDGVKSIELAEDNSAVEIWFEKDNEVYVMYLFNYDFGVVRCAR